MPRKKITKIKALSQDKSGRFFKNIGWVRNPTSGKFSQRKFYLGHDDEAAKLAAARLDALWQCVERRHNKQAFYANILGEEFPERTRHDFEPGNVMILKEIDPRPTWCPLSLSLAEAIRKGQPVARIALENVPHRNIPREVRDWLFRTRQEFNVVHIEFDEEPSCVRERTADPIWIVFSLLSQTLPILAFAFICVHSRFKLIRMTELIFKQECHKIVSCAMEVLNKNAMAIAKCNFIQM